MSLTIFYSLFRIDALSGFIILAAVFFSALIIMYSLRYMRSSPHILNYYLLVLATAIFSIGAIAANHLIVLLVCWGFLGLGLYLLIAMGDKNSPAAAKKTFIIVGGTDALMLLGIGVLYRLTGTFQMDAMRLELNNGPAVCAYLCLAIACFAKAGAMPFHSWIPDCAKSAPVSVTAYLPASMDKLLGIYLLARISLHLFVMNGAMNLFLMLIGAFTIIAAVMMAMVQHNMKRLLGYHAVSQVGYMVLGIGTGNPVGIAGGLFHMLNHAVYKSCLFLAGGNVEYRTRTSELNELGGLAKLMPITYISCLIASLSISGVPPFNGFFSKWMIYQGLVEKVASRQSPVASVVCLAAAMFGSGLTLASFMKLMHAIFLGQTSKFNKQDINEVSWTMWLPCAILAGLCIIFGIFAIQIPLKYFILPATGKVAFIGSWYAGMSTLLVIIGFIVGLVIFTLKGLRPNIRQDTAYVGAETAAFDAHENSVSGTEFYNTIRELGFLKGIYKKAEAGLFDIYEQGKNLVFGVGRFFQYLHNGVLPTYLVWTLLGMIGLFLMLLKK